MPNRIVVAGAVVSGNAVLVAQRKHPPELAGRWELPGGKAAPGESECEAQRVDVDWVPADRDWLPALSRLL